MWLNLLSFFVGIEIVTMSLEEEFFSEVYFHKEIFPISPRNFLTVVGDPILWPDGVIIYRIDPRIGCPVSEQCNLLMRAFDDFHLKTCTRFQEWSGEKDYVKIFFNKDYPEDCWSAVGRQGGAQPVSLGYRCWYLGNIVHELGHTLGLWHEMNRPDRDDYIEIFWNNIKPGYEPAFEKQYVKSLNIDDNKFDVKSIMMYDEYAFAKDNKSPTIATKDKSIIGPIWQKPGLSESDVQRLDKLYDCKGSTRSLKGFPYNVHCSFDTHSCGFKNVGKTLWQWAAINNTDGYIFTSSNGSVPEDNNITDSYIAIGYLMSVNFHPISDPSKSPFGCLRFWYMNKGTDNYLKLLQSYLSKPTQLAYVSEDTFDLWETETNLETNWTLIELSLYVTTPFKIIFESGFGVGSDGLIALDDLELTFSPCKGFSTKVKMH